MHTTRQLVTAVAIAVTSIAIVGSVQAGGLCHGGGRGFGGGGYGGRGAGISVGGVRIGAARGGSNHQHQGQQYNGQQYGYGQQQAPVYVAPAPKVVAAAPKKPVAPAPKPVPAVVKQAPPAPQAVATVEPAIRPELQIVSTTTNIMPVDSLPPVDRQATKPAEPIIAEAPLPQVPVGATLTLQGTDLSNKPGQVMLQVGDISLPATIKEWNNDSVVCTLPMLGLTKPSKATLHVITADGKTASSVTCELVTAIATSVGTVASN